MKVFMGKYPKKGDAKRKISIRIDPYDTWNMDNDLARIIVPMLKQLKRTKHGVPNEFFTNPDFCNDVDVKEADKRWSATLDKMIWSFTQINRDWEKQFWSGRSDIRWKKLDNGCTEMVTGPRHTMKYDQESANVYQEKIQEGLDLFAKHYFNLWD